MGAFLYGVGIFGFFFLDILVSSYSPKTFRLDGYTKLPIGVNMSVSGCPVMDLVSCPKWAEISSSFKELGSRYLCSP